MTYEEIKYNKNKQEIMLRAQLFYETYKDIRKLVNLETNEIAIWNGYLKNINFLNKNKRKIKPLNIKFWSSFVTVTLKQNL